MPNFDEEYNSIGQVIEKILSDGKKVFKIKNWAEKGKALDDLIARIKTVCERNSKLSFLVEKKPERFIKGLIQKMYLSTYLHEFWTHRQIAFEKMGDDAWRNARIESMKAIYVLYDHFPRLIPFLAVKNKGIRTLIEKFVQKAQSYYTEEAYAIRDYIRALGENYRLNHMKRRKTLPAEKKILLKRMKNVVQLHDFGCVKKPGKRDTIAHYNLSNADVINKMHEDWYAGSNMTNYYYRIKDGNGDQILLCTNNDTFICLNRQRGEKEKDTYEFHNKTYNHHPSIDQSINKYRENFSDQAWMPRGDMFINISSETYLNEAKKILFDILTDYSDELFNVEDYSAELLLNHRQVKAMELEGLKEVIENEHMRFSLLVTNETSCDFKKHKKLGEAISNDNTYFCTQSNMLSDKKDCLKRLDAIKRLITKKEKVKEKEQQQQQRQQPPPQQQEQRRTGTKRKGGYRDSALPFKKRKQGKKVTPSAQNGNNRFVFLGTQGNRKKADNNSGAKTFSRNPFI